MPTFSLAGQHKKRKSDDEQLLEMCAIVALHYPQYTLQELVNDVPLKHVQFLYEQVQKWRAETLLLLNVIQNGPNSKDKSHSSYKKVIKELTKIANK